MNSSAETDQECEEEGGRGYIRKCGGHKKTEVGSSLGRRSRIGAVPTGAVCSVVSKVTGTDWRGSGCRGDSGGMGGERGVARGERMRCSLAD